MAMLEVKDLEVYYGVIQAIKGISFHVDKGAAFAQGIFIPFGITEDDEVNDERTGGFGSTDKR